MKRRGKTPQSLADSENDHLKLDIQDSIRPVINRKPKRSLWEGKGVAAPRLFGIFAPPFRMSYCSDKVYLRPKRFFTSLKEISRP
ncbi:MAG TPA: hypothetical protein VN260_02695, partial [Dissulfurispiraceae bacterium]|nr:hypothetical protein [Dissulfurispiraceae bacterium]